MDGLRRHTEGKIHKLHMPNKNTKELQGRNFWGVRFSVHRGQGGPQPRQVRLVCLINKSGPAHFVPGNTTQSLQTETD